MSARAEIEDTLRRHAWAFDEHDVETLADCLSGDAELVVPGGSVVGREAIVARWDAARSAMAERGEQPRHLLANVVVDELSETEATTRTYYAMFLTSGGVLAPQATGRYLDRLVLEGGRWRIAYRRGERDA